MEESLNLLLTEPRPSKPKDTKRFYKEVVHKDRGAQLSGLCMFCNKKVTSTGATRLVDHLIDCVHAVKEIKDLCKQLRQKTATKRQLKDLGEARGERRGERREARGERREARGERREARGER
ncbi:hypothetical protein AB1Y20_014360 [Prymnesium parvum]|uniref:BED-type domain-containing protein n=1 Tax=Prymnesium parvum TaxID=97485 RepID=A0AB34IDG2_PRYPA